MDISQLNSALYLEINLFSIILVAIIAVRTRGISQMVAQRNFTMALYTLIVFFASDTLWILIENGTLPFSRFWLLATKDVYFFFTSLMCFAWFVYFEYLQNSPLVKSKKQLTYSGVFVLLQLILIIINKFTGILYFVNDNNEYMRGPLFLSLYVLSYIYVIFTCGRAFIGSFKATGKNSRITLIKLASFPILPAIGGLVQFGYPKLPMVCGTLSITVLLLYLDWTTQLISVDPLTGLNNRKQLINAYDHLIKNNANDDVPIYLLMIDANKFKQINDTYGHIEGDAALVRIADSLRKGCVPLKRRANIARYGGDEFVIVVKAESDDVINDLVTRIREELKKLNDMAKSPYEVTVSIGIARAGEHEVLPLEQLAHRADEKLYEEKARLKKGTDKK